jgi:hypothetical protein
MTDQVFSGQNGMDLVCLVFQDILDLVLRFGFGLGLFGFSGHLGSGSSVWIWTWFVWFFRTSWIWFFGLDLDLAWFFQDNWIWFIGYWISFFSLDIVFFNSFDNTNMM